MKKYNRVSLTLPEASLRVCLFLCAWLLSPALAVRAQEGGRAAAQSLQPNHATERALRGGETHVYTIYLKAGEYFHVEVDQRGIDVRLTLVDATGKLVAERDRPNGARGAEALSFISASAGEYSLSVHALEAKAEPGRYEINGGTPLTPAAAAARRVEAETLLQEGLQLSQTKTAEAVGQACERYAASAALWRGLEDKYAEALTQTTLGYGRESLREYEKAVAAHERAAALYGELGNRPSEAASLSRLCLLNARLLNPEKATAQYRRAKLLYQEAKDPEAEGRLNTEFEQLADALRIVGTQLMTKGEIGALRQAQKALTTAQAVYVELGNETKEALALIGLGGISSLLGEHPQSLAYYNRALDYYRAKGNKAGETLTLTSISRVYADIGDKATALDYLNQALPQIKAAGDKKVEALTLINIGRLYFDTGDKPQALEYHTGALSLYRELGNKAGEVTALNSIGAVYSEMGDKRKALEFDEQALSLARELKDKVAEGNILNSIGRTYASLGETRKALESFNQAQPLLKAAGNKAGETVSLLGLGRIYSTLGDKPKVLEQLNQAMALAKLLVNPRGEATVLNGIGGLYAGIGENQKALESYNLALSLDRAMKDRRGEAITLGNIGGVYANIGESQKALENNKLALDIYRERGDRDGEAYALSGIGRAYSDLGEKLEALGSYNQALSRVRGAGNRRAEITILNNIAGIYSDIGDNRKALETYEQALPLANELEDSQTIATLLNNIGGAHSELGDKQKALELYFRALPLRRKTESKRGEAVTLNNIGHAYSTLGDNKEALKYYSQALPLMKAAGDKSGEATVLSNMMFVWNSLDNARFAIFYGKLSVNAYQQLRSTNQTLKDNELQISLLKVVEKNYRYLASLLIEQGRLAEAQQVLNAFKDQQYLDFDPQTIRKLPPLAMTRREAELASGYDATSDRVGRAGSRLGDLRRAMGDRAAGGDEAATLQQLEAELQAATNEFLSTVRKAEAEFGGRPEAVKDDPPAVADTREMQAALLELAAQTRQTAVAVYTLIGEKEFRALIVTPEKIIPVVVPVPRREFDEKAQAFSAGLSEIDERTNRPKFTLAEVQRAGKELYDLVFAPVAARLKEFNLRPEVLMWSLDGRLRYVPVAALYDGKQYLAERYRNVVFTRADPKQMLSPVSRAWAGTGFYASRGYTEAVNGKMNFYRGLVNAKSEVETIFGVPPTKGVVKGQFLPDEQFTRTTLLERLRQHLALVHIASHFRLVPGDASSSFLLLGDGKKLTLADIKGAPEELFGGVELLTLSACETGAQRERESDGREVDSLAELAQRKRAQAIMASLWIVDDGSTSRLMTEFYRGRELHNLTKAEALQRAQQGLLKDGRYSHPFYWSAFILVGNWR